MIPIEDIPTKKIKITNEFGEEETIEIVEASRLKEVLLNRLSFYGFAILPDVSTNAASITTDTLPDKHCQLNVEGGVYKIFFNAEGTLKSWTIT